MGDVCYFHILTFGVDRVDIVVSDTVCCFISTRATERKEASGTRSSTTTVPSTHFITDDFVHRQGHHNRHQDSPSAHEKKRRLWWQQTPGDNSRDHRPTSPAMTTSRVLPLLPWSSGYISPSCSSEGHSVHCLFCLEPVLPSRPLEIDTPSATIENADHPACVVHISDHDVGGDAYSGFSAHLSQGVLNCMTSLTPQVRVETTGF